MWPNAQETADLVTFTEEILSGKLHFLSMLEGFTREISFYLLHFIYPLLELYSLYFCLVSASYSACCEKIDKMVADLESMKEKVRDMNSRCLFS